MDRVTRELRREGAERQESDIRRVYINYKDKVELLQGDATQCT